jgi:hypothetical protein
MAMSRLAGAIDGVIGVDTHRDTLAAAATDMVGGLLAQTVVEVGRPKRPPRRSGPRATPWTPSALRGRPSPMTIRWRRVVAATGRRCGCCWRLATTLARPRSAPPIS